MEEKYSIPPPEKCRTSGDGMEEEQVPIKDETKTTINPLEYNYKYQKSSIISIDIEKERHESIKKSSSLNPTSSNNTLNWWSPAHRVTTTYPSKSSSKSKGFPGLHRKSSFLGAVGNQRIVPPPTNWPKPGNLVLLKPHLLKYTNSTLPDHKNIKPPRFVPCEPYIGAVTPLTDTVPHFWKRKQQRKTTNGKTKSIMEWKKKEMANLNEDNSNQLNLNKKLESTIALKDNPEMDKIRENQEQQTTGKYKNNLDINVLVRQMSNLRAQEMQTTNTLDEERNKSHEANQLEKNQETSNMEKINNNTENLLLDNVPRHYETTEHIQKLQQQIQHLTDERNYYQNQFKFQTQVNGELKNLLVASMGEDLQTRVNVLTEDKLQLAKALLDTAKHLSTHTEQIEFLAGQCEVWRSKFLATSVMVEELARWKADLTEKNELLTNSTRKLLTVMQQIRDMQLELVKNLKFIGKIRNLSLPATDVMTLSAENLNISQKLILHAGFGMPEDNIITTMTNNSSGQGSSLRLCEAERYAMESLDFISQPLMSTDEAIKALFGQTQKSFHGSGGMKTSHEEMMTSFAPSSNTHDGNNINETI